MADAVTDWTDAPPSHAPREPGDEPIPGYRLIAPLGRGGFGEVWKCEAPGGLLKAIKFVHGALGLECGLDVPAAEEMRAIQRIKAVRHPYLLSMERVEQLGRELVIVLELADHNLAAVLAAEQEAGRPGVPRERLLGYLREAAEALDLMNFEHDLQHLDVKPQNLFLVGNHVKVGDFGRVNTFAGGGSGQPGGLLGAITPMYAAPELFENALSRHCDQYSLAIVYQELLTGVRPFTGKNGRQLLMQHLRGEPDLGPLPAADRAAVGRGLSKRPADRFPSCSDFVHALAAGQTEVVTVRDVSLTREVEAPPPETEVVPPLDLSGESLDDLRLLDCIRRTPLSEVHRAQRADGGERLVTMLFGCAGKGDDLNARLSGLHHPALVPVKVVRDPRGDLALITAPGGRPLRDRLHECLAAKQSGIPRAELLAHLRAAAAALDFLHQRHTIAHLGLNPRNLLLEDDRLRIGDFGVAHLLWLPAGRAVARLNPRYSAPELFHGQAGPACDQYSLALIYHELLTGGLPVFREIEDEAGTHKSHPVLDRLPEADRFAVARALEADPARRWGSCTEMVRALEEGEGDKVASEEGRGGHPAGPPGDGPFLTGGGGPSAVASDVLQTWFTTFLSPEKIRARLDGFRQQWRGTIVLADEGGFVYQMPTPRSFWQRWTGRHPGLEVRIGLSSSPTPAGPATRVEVEVRPHDCGKEHGGELLGGVAPLLVESVRTFLQVNWHHRGQERLAWRHPLQMCSVSADGTVGPAVECQGKDISLGGISFYLPGEPPTVKLSLVLPQTAQTPAATVLARVVRIHGCGAGWYEVGAVLLRGEEEATTSPALS